MSQPKPVILIVGPTAGGKSRLAIDLARQLPTGGECISCDSMQIYRGMDIGTAKPTPSERGEVPHHLIDIVEPSDDSFNVDRWLELARITIDEIHKRGRVPIIVGGTNLYVQAFLGGMMAGPEPDPALRTRLEQMSTPDLRQWLERVDAPAAERIHPNDRKRTIRAIEVFELTGERLSQSQTQWAGATEHRDSLATRFDTLMVGLDFPSPEINRRINARVKQMIETGLVEEVRRLHDARAMGRNAREALGYKQIIEYLEGKVSFEEAIEQTKIRTRRYAKQQRTWLRRFRAFPNSIWIRAEEPDPTQHLAAIALTAILQRL